MTEFKELINPTTGVNKEGDIIVVDPSEIDGDVSLDSQIEAMQDDPEELVELVESPEQEIDDIDRYLTPEERAEYEKAAAIYDAALDRLMDGGNPLSSDLAHAQLKQEGKINPEIAKNKLIEERRQGALMKASEQVLRQTKEDT